MQTHPRNEMISFAFTVMIVCNLTLWMREGALEYLVRIAVGFSGLFLTRYESIPFAAAVSLASRRISCSVSGRNGITRAAGAGKSGFTSRAR